MRKAVILHGTNGSPHENWFPWLKKELKAKGYQVWVPDLPGKNRPNGQIYNDFLLNADWDFTHNLVIGHSSGAVSVLNLLMDGRFPKIKTAVMVSAWHDSAKATLRYGGLSSELFKDLFPKEGFDFDLINQKTDNALFVHSDNDPYCPLDQAEWLAKQMKCDLVTIHDGDHLGSKFPEFPQLTYELGKRGWL